MPALEHVHRSLHPIIKNLVFEHDWDFFLAELDEALVRIELIAEAHGIILLAKVTKGCGYIDGAWSHIQEVLLAYQLGLLVLQKLDDLL